MDAWRHSDRPQPAQVPPEGVEKIVIAMRAVIRTSGALIRALMDEVDDLDGVADEFDAFIEAMDESTEVLRSEADVLTLLRDVARFEGGEPPEG